MKEVPEKLYFRQLLYITNIGPVNAVWLLKKNKWRTNQWNSPLHYHV